MEKVPDEKELETKSPHTSFSTEQANPTVITPIQTTSRNNPFLPLDPDNTVIATIMKKQQKKKQEQKKNPPKVDDPKMDDLPRDTQDDDVNKDDISSQEDKTTPAKKSQTNEREPLVDNELGTLLENLFDEININDPKPHEILQGLSFQGIKSWTSFIWMDEDDIKNLVKPSRHQPLPLSNHSIRMIGHLKRLIWDKMEQDDPHAQDSRIYTKQEFSKYVNSMNIKKRNNVINSLHTSGIPAFSATSSKSSGEKKYEAWTKTIGKRMKTSFEVLKADDQYLVWKPIFEAELAHQKMSHCLDKAFNPDSITCSYEKELWKEQHAYLWTIALHVLKNPLGQTCISAHMKDRDARSAFAEHDRLQEHSPAKSFNTSMTLSALSDLSIKGHNGSRVDFIATWFEQLRRLNELTNDTLSYDMTKGLLLSSLHGDPKLPDVFTELTETNDDDVDLEHLKTLLLFKAGLYDSKDKYLKTNLKATQTIIHENDESLLIHRATTNPEARLPDHIYNTLTIDDKSAWRQLPESTRIKFSRIMQAKQPAASPPTRKLYNMDTSTASSTLTDGSNTAELLSIFKQLLNDKTHHHSSDTRPPSIDQARSNDSMDSSAAPSVAEPSPKSTQFRAFSAQRHDPDNAKSTVKSPLKSSMKKNLPKKSTLDPGNPAILLAKPPIDLYDEAGNHYGHINMSFHRWFTSADDQPPDEPYDGASKTYTVSNGKISNAITETLIDRGANGCVAGADCVWIGGPVLPRNVSITGIDNHQVNNIPIGTVGAYTITNRGPVICIFNEVAYTGRHKSILSSFQLEHYGNDVSEKNPMVGGKGNISTPDGYIFPLSYKSGLPYLKMRKYTQREYNDLPHVIMTSDKEWDPSIFDRDIDINAISQVLPEELHRLPHQDYNLEGEYIRANTVHQMDISLHNQGHVHFTEYVNVEGIDNKNHSEEPEGEQQECESDLETENIFDFWIKSEEYNRLESIDRCIKSARLQAHLSDSNSEHDLLVNEDARIHTPSTRDYSKLKPYFTWIPTKLIEATFKNSTQYGYMPTSPDGNLFKRWKAPNPAMNVFRLQDDLLTDKVYSDTPAIDSGHTESQVFFGRKSHVVHVEPISKKYPFIKGLQNFVRKWGAPLRLLGDHAGNQSSHSVMDYLRMLWIGNWRSEPYYKHQNMFERRYQTFKRTVNRTMDRTNTPAKLWYHCMQYVAYVLNRVSDPTLNLRQPIFVATGQVADISAILPFRWMEPVYYRAEDSSFPSKTNEHLGHWIGIAEHVGHGMTFKIWNKRTDKIVHRSAVRSASSTNNQNYRANDAGTPPLPDEIIIGSRIAKRFQGVLYFGTIKKRWTDNPEPLWHIQYDDEDSEDLTLDELHDSIELYKSHRQDDPSPVTLSPPSSRLRLITAQDYGEQEPGRPPGPGQCNDIIYSIDDEGIKETTSYAEDSYFNENADPKDYLLPHPIHLDDPNNTFVVLLDNDGQPKLNHEGKPILIKGIDKDILRGKTFLKQETDGTTNRVRVLEMIDDQRKGVKEYTKFKIKYDRTDIEDIMAYNEIMNAIYKEESQHPEYEWKFRKILSHQGPLNKRSPGWKGDKFNVEIEWENGEISIEAFQEVFADDPITLAIYARDNDLLEEEGWKRLKPYVRRHKKFQRLIKQAKLRSFRTAPKYMYGYQVPRTYEEAVELDRKNGNTKWADATRLEMEQLDEYNTFIDKGPFHPSKIPIGFKKIKVHLVFAVKHDGRHKSRLVSRGDLTDIPLDSVYAGVVSLRGLRMVIFIAELNGMEAYATDIGNAYLEAITREKVCIKAGPEFGDREGHLLIIYKALYGLRSSGKEFGDLLASCLMELGFFPSRAEPEIFMRENDGVYEYVATYVDDLCFVMKDPLAFLKQLKSEPYSFKLKGSGPMSFHLGCGFDRDTEGTLRMNPRKYVDKMMQTYEQLYGSKPPTTPLSPLPENDHPELDITEFLDEEGIQQYQSLIGSLQWAISIGRWDIQTAVMSLSSFRAQPRKGHLERVKRIYGYLNRFKHFDIKFRTDEPDMSHFDNKTNFDWSKSIYGDSPEDIPADAPTPLGNKVTLVHYFDANLMHDVLSGKAVTGCIHLANKTPMMWYSKKQATSETATYGAEFLAGRTCIEQMIDLRQTFRYLGVPVHPISYMFGDNETMINSASFPEARLHKRHNILSFHFVRDMISKGFIALHHLKSKDNLADILTKHWSHNSVYNLLRPIFHHTGNTAKLYIDDSPGCLDEVLIRPDNKCLDGSIIFTKDTRRGSSK